LGLTTDTEDTTGNTLTTSDALPSRDRVAAAMDHFRGNIMQVPPMVSALKVGGHKLVDLARQGIEVERQARPVTIHSLLCEPTDTPSDYVLDVTCSGGTYIRTLCADIGAALGCGGAMAALDRRAACGFTIEQSVTVAELEQMSTDERMSRLIPTEQLFARLASVTLSAFYDRLIGNGCAVALAKLRLSLALGTRVRLCHTDGSFFALGEVVESDGGLALKAIKTFVL
jgi:tRNA pseudouridine55 synthase